MKRFFLGIMASTMVFSFANTALAEEASKKQPILVQQTESGKMQMAVVPKFDSEEEFKNYMETSSDSLEWIPLVETSHEEMAAIDSDIEGDSSNSWYVGWQWGWGTGYRYYRPYYHYYGGYNYYRYPYYGYWGFNYNRTYYYYGRPYYYCW